MADKFIPESDHAFADMAYGFAQGIAASPSLYALSAGDASFLSGIVERYRNALAILSDPARRTTVAVTEKNQARVDAEKIIRHFANLIRVNAGVPDGAKVAIGVRMRPTKLRRRQVPASSPILDLIGGTPNCHTLRYHDTNNPNSSAKPFGARVLQLFCEITEYGQTPTANPGRAVYVGEYGRNPIGVQHDSTDAGKTATYFARWVGARNEHGPWSLPVSATIMGGTQSVPLARKPESKAHADHGKPELKRAA